MTKLDFNETSWNYSSMVKLMVSMHEAMFIQTQRHTPKHTHIHYSEKLTLLTSILPLLIVL